MFRIHFFKERILIFLKWKVLYVYYKIELKFIHLSWRFILLHLLLNLKQFPFLFLNLFAVKFILFGIQSHVLWQLHSHASTITIKNNSFASKNPLTLLPVVTLLVPPSNSGQILTRSSSLWLCFFQNVTKWN